MASAKLVLASSLAPGSNSDSIRLKSESPYLIQTGGGYTGNVTVEHSMDNSNWVTLQAMATGTMYDVQHPLKYVRVKGDHTGTTTANVYLLEEVIG